MAKLDILRKGRREDTIDGEPRDFGEARQMLQSWLEAERWHPDRWPEFSIMIPGPVGSREVNW